MSERWQVQVVKGGIMKRKDFPRFSLRQLIIDKLFLSMQLQITLY